MFKIQIAILRSDLKGKKSSVTHLHDFPFSTSLLDFLNFSNLINSCWFFEKKNKKEINNKRTFLPEKAYVLKFTSPMHYTFKKKKIHR